MPTRNSRRSSSSSLRDEGWQFGDELEVRSTPVHARRLTSSSLAPASSSRAVFASVLVLSLLIHAALLGWRFSSRTSPTARSTAATDASATLVELTPEAGSPPPTPPVPPDLQGLQEFHTTAVERTGVVEEALAAAIQQRAQVEEAHRQQVTNFEHERVALTGQLETLAVEKAELATQLSHERQRASELAEELEKARQEKEHVAASVKGAYDQLVAALKGEISQKDIALHQAQQRLVVSILDRVLFPSGQAALTPEGQRILSKVSRILANIADQRILIEGHTDNVPIRPPLSLRFPTNWELSTARATEVVKYLLAQTHLPGNRFTAVGRADTAPIASNTTEAGRAQNRRIEIILLPLEEPGKDLS
ncbi:MAG TPA: OmpA family protein [Methylomirabilota bacterium]|nr:OmpA family protein [Methylomirabilota bacterium]